MMKKYFLTLMAFVVFGAAPAFAQSATEFTQSTKYATSIKKLNRLPKCTDPHQILTYDGTYKCVDNYALSCPPGRILRGVNPDSTPICDPVATGAACPAGQAYTGGTPPCEAFTESLPTCSPNQVVTSTPTGGWVCKDIGRTFNVPIATLSFISGGGCNASNAMTPAGQASGVSGLANWRAVTGTNWIYVFSMECTYACNQFCALQADFSTGVITEWNGAGQEAACLCVR